MKNLWEHFKTALLFAVVGSVAALAMRQLHAPSAPPSGGRMGINGPNSWSTANWYIDPANSTGCASDGNTCTSATCGGGSIGPCVTHGQIVSRLGSLTPTFSIAVTETQLSDQSSGQLANDQIALTPNLVGSNGTFTYQGSLIQVTTATIGTYTARNTTTGVPDKITANGQSGAYWTAFLYDFVHDTTHDGWFFVEKDLGTATAQITRPVQACSSDNIHPAVVSIANSDALVVYRFPKTNISTIAAISDNSVSGGTSIAHVLFTAGSSTGTNGINGASTGLSNMLEVQTDVNTFWLTSFATEQSVFSCDSLMNGFISRAAIDYYAGAIVAPFAQVAGSPSSSALTELEGGILIDTQGEWHVNGQVTVTDAYFGNSPDTDNGSLLSIGNYDDGTGLIWGPAAFDAHDGTRVVCYGGCTANLLLTGGLTMHGQTSAYPWIQQTNSYGASVPITTANIDLYHGLFDPRTGDGFMDHP